MGEDSKVLRAFAAMRGLGPRADVALEYGLWILTLKNHLAELDNTRLLDWAREEREGHWERYNLDLACQECARRGLAI